MKIGIDGNEANVKHKVGVSVYTYELLKRFSASQSKHTFVVYLRQKPLPHMPKETDLFKYQIINAPRMWRNVFFPLYLHTHKEIDVLFCPAHYTPTLSPVPIVVTIHDVSYFDYPDEFLKSDAYKLTHWTEHAIHQARDIICVSEFTRSEVVQHFPEAQKKTHTVLNGLSMYEPSKQNTSILPKDPYIMYVGTLQPRKNISRLIEAFKYVLNEDSSYKLVITGKKGWLYDEILQKAQSIGIGKSVIFTGFVSDEDKYTLMKHAQMYVLPSLYEGFGLPVIEAQSIGTPVAASNTSCLKEVGGDACVYFDPHDTMNIAKTIISVMHNEKLQKELKEKGLKNALRFNWDDTAHQTLNIITQNHEQ